jgi:biopolymer transport protein ExbD
MPPYYLIVMATNPTPMEIGRLASELHERYDVHVNTSASLQTNGESDASLSVWVDALADARTVNEIVNELQEIGFDQVKFKETKTENIRIKGVE